MFPHWLSAFTPSNPKSPRRPARKRRAGYRPRVEALEERAVPANVGINDFSIIEGNAGTTNGVFTVSLDQAEPTPVTVQFITVDGTATAGEDYVATDGLLTIPAGSISGSIIVPIIGDTRDEPNESFSLTLFNLKVGNTLADGNGVGTILDDDPPASISISDAEVTEGNFGPTSAVFTVSLSAVSEQDVTVGFGTVDGSANSSDYVGSSGSVTIPAGSTSASIVITVTGDTQQELDETFFVNLSSADNGTIQAGSGTGTILNDDITPTLTIGDAEVTEGDAGTVNAVFTVSLSAVSSQTVTASFSTTAGTATAGEDFTANSGTVSIPAGSTSATINIPVKGDTLDELDETFTVTLSNPNNANLADSQGVGTILDDDDPPTLSVGDTTVAEGTDGTNPAFFTVTLSAPSGLDVTADFSTANGTALAGQDYVAASGSVTIPAGSTTAVVMAVVNGDTAPEGNETFVLNLSNATNATIADGQGQATIEDATPPPTTPSGTIDDVTVIEGTLGTTTLIFTIILSDAVVGPQPAVFNFTTADGTATAGLDYVTGSGIVSIAPGTTSGTVTVTVLGDALDEPDETVVVTLSVLSGDVTLADDEAVGTLADDDGNPSLSVGDASSVEGTNGTVNGVIPVTLGAPSGQDVTVNFITTSSTAVAGQDFTATSGTVVIPAGSTTGTIIVPILGDASNEADETFTITLFDATNGTLSDAIGTFTIQDDDPVPLVSVADASAAEGDAGTTTLTFTLTLSTVSGLPVTVNFSTAPGTATAADFAAATGTVTFSPGTTSQTVTVAITGDNIDETDETLFLNLNSPTNAALGDGSAVGTITDNDAPPVVSVNDVTVAEGDTGTVASSFTVSLSAASARTVTVNFATAPGSAGASDFQAASGTLTFDPGQTSQTFTVTVNGDTANEPIETFTVNLASPSNATIADGTGVGTIIDNDNPGIFQFSQATFTVNEAGGQATITVNRLGGTASGVTVDFATSNGTATAGQDYQTATGTLTFAAGEAVKTFTVPIINDTRVSEGNQTVNLTLLNPTGGATLGAQSTAVLSIADDEQQFATVNQIFIGQAYVDILRRPVDPQGLSFWTSFLSSPGGSRQTLALALETSPEGRTFVINDLYQKFFGRGVDPAGLDGGLRFLAAGGTLDQYKAILLGSPEYFAGKGNNNVDTFLGAVYQDVLGRPIDQGGLTFWKGALQQGFTRQQVAQFILGSLDADKFVVQQTYPQFLLRPADNDGINFWAGMLQKGLPDQVFASFLVASAEYFANLGK